MNPLNIETAFVFAVVSLVISIITVFENFKSSRRDTFTKKMDYYGKILDWYKETIILMKHIEYKSDMHESCKMELESLSALIEYGRFFFPNIIVNDHGNEKPEAYRGYRNITLDFIVAYYNLFNFDLRGEYPENAPKIIQQYFTSQVFKSIKPQVYVKQAERCTKASSTNKEQLENQIGENDKFIVNLVFNYKQ